MEITKVQVPSSLSKIHVQGLGSPGEGLGGEDPHPQDRLQREWSELSWPLVTDGECPVQSVTSTHEASVTSLPRQDLAPQGQPLFWLLPP